MEVFGNVERFVNTVKQAFGNEPNAKTCTEIECGAHAHCELVDYAGATAPPPVLLQQQQGPVASPAGPVPLTDPAAQQIAHSHKVTS